MRPGSFVSRFLERLAPPGRLKKRSDLINFLIRQHGYERYLEIGVHDARRNFDKIRIAHKESVDPAPEGPVTHLMTSDELFARLASQAAPEPFDIVFVDGLHEAAAAERDILNALRFLRAGGSIVVHDCNPAAPELQATERPSPGAHWSGTVWKAWVKLRATRSDLAMYVVDMDRGCGVIRAGTQVCVDLRGVAPEALSYDLLARSRTEVLNLITRRECVRLESAQRRK